MSDKSDDSTRAADDDLVERVVAEMEARGMQAPEPESEPAFKPPDDPPHLRLWRLIIERRDALAHDLREWKRFEHRQKKSACRAAPEDHAYVESCVQAAHDRLQAFDRRLKQGERESANDRGLSLRQLRELVEEAEVGSRNNAKDAVVKWLRSRKDPAFEPMMRSYAEAALRSLRYPHECSLDAPSRTRIAVRCGRSLSTVSRAYRGVRVAATSRQSIVEAARELGLPEPPDLETLRVAATGDITASGSHERVAKRMITKVLSKKG